MKKIILYMFVVSLFIMALTVNGYAQINICLEDSWGYEWNMIYVPFTGNMTGDTAPDIGFGSYNLRTSGINLTWLAVESKCSGTFQGVWIGNGSPVTWANDCGGSGDDAFLYVCGMAPTTFDPIADDPRN